MNMTMTIEIPALDRLCGWLESRDKAGMVEAIENEIVKKLKEAAEGGVPRPKFEQPKPVEPKPEAKPEPPKPAPEPQKAPQEPPKPAGPVPPEPTNVPPEASAPAATGATLDAIQRAAAQMRDEGKLKAVIDLFPTYGIKKLSDLKGHALQDFAGELRRMGAKI